MRSYGQFCPVAVASQVFAERWTPIILRELLSGSHRFNHIRNGVPLISRSLLAQRLRELEDAGVITSRPLPGGRGRDYQLTKAGAARGSRQARRVGTAVGELAVRAGKPRSEPAHVGHEEPGRDGPPAGSPGGGALRLPRGPRTIPPSAHLVARAGARWGRPLLPGSWASGRPRGRCRPGRAGARLDGAPDLRPGAAGGRRAHRGRSRARARLPRLAPAEPVRAVRTRRRPRLSAASSMENSHCLCEASVYGGYRC